jgi:hypothetical protein
MLQLYRLLRERFLDALRQYPVCVASHAESIG